MILTNAQQKQAEELGLTSQEMVVAFKTGIPPEKYAAHKRALAGDRDAWEGRVAAADCLFDGAEKSARGVAKE